MFKCFHVTRISDLIKKEISRQKLNGAAVCFIDHVAGGNNHVKCHGIANAEHGARVSARTVFDIGDLGHQFTALAVLLQIEDGAFSLHDQITQFFPSAPAEWAKITIYHLLTHTSGLCDYYTEEFDDTQEWTSFKALTRAFIHSPHVPPGIRFMTCNTNYLLLGYILDNTGHSREEIVTTRIFQKLNMHSSRCLNSRAIVRHRAQGYENNEHVVARHRSTEQFGDTGFLMNISDLCRWERAVRQRAPICKKETWDLFSAPAILKNGKKVPFGCGMALPTTGESCYLSGHARGFSAAILRAPEYSILVLSNSHRASLRPLVQSIEHKIMHVEPPKTNDSEESMVKMRCLINKLIERRIDKSDIAYPRGGWRPGIPRAFQSVLDPIGHLVSLRLIARYNLGNETCSEYEIKCLRGTKIVRHVVDAANKTLEIDVLV